MWCAMYCSMEPPANPTTLVARLGEAEEPVSALAGAVALVAEGSAD